MDRWIDRCCLLVSVVLSVLMIGVEIDSTPRMAGSVPVVAEEGGGLGELVRIIINNSDINKIS